MMRLVPWGLVGALLIVYVEAEYRREAAAAELEERLRRMRSRLVAAMSAARRFRRERDAAQAEFDGAVEYMSNIKQHGMTVLRVADHEYLCAQRNRAVVAAAEAQHLRGALELIADGCLSPQRIAVEALGRGEEESCRAN